jgi:hypothetical protein
MEVGVLVGVMVGDGMSVSVGTVEGVAVVAAGNIDGRLQARADNTSRMAMDKSFFMQRTIHARGRGVKEGAAVSGEHLVVSS